jgi:hypothetical protein
MLQMARKILYFDTSIKKVPIQKNRQTTWDWQWKYEEGASSSLPLLSEFLLVVNGHLVFQYIITPLQ